MRAVDTNLLVRLLVRDEPKQVAAAEEFVERGAWVSRLVLAETRWVLDAVHEQSPSHLAAALDLLLDHQHLTLKDADVVRRALAHCCARPALGFSDCLVLAIARKAGHLPLGTFDKNLADLEGTQRL